MCEFKYLILFTLICLAIFCYVLYQYGKKKHMYHNGIVTAKNKVEEKAQTLTNKYTTTFLGVTAHETLSDEFNYHFLINTNIIYYIIIESSSFTIVEFDDNQDYVNSIKFNPYFMLFKFDSKYSKIIFIISILMLIGGVLNFWICI